MNINTTLSEMLTSTIWAICHPLLSISYRKYYQKSNPEITLSLHPYYQPSLVDIKGLYSALVFIRWKSCHWQLITHILREYFHETADNSLFLSCCFLSFICTFIYCTKSFLSHLLCSLIFGSFILSFSFWFFLFFLLSVFLLQITFPAFQKICFSENLFSRLFNFSLGSYIYLIRSFILSLF